MKISGFTIIRNAVIYDFPIVESIKSILDLVDEYIVVAGDSTDATDELISSINSPKIKVIKTVWDNVKYRDKGMVYAAQTDIALQACSGDWCIYLQSDEVIHEDSLPIIREACQKHLLNEKVEGFILKYTHFYGDYNHYIDALHFGYPREVRIVRRREDIHSWRDAQSFRSIKDFDYVDYWQSENTRKLNCVLLNTKLFHYGWSRDPRLMVKKIQEQASMHEPDKKCIPNVDYHDYGNISKFPIFKGTHPAVMKERIENCPWKEYLRYEGAKPDIKKIFGTKYRFVRLIEKYILRDGRTLGGFKNYNLVGKE